MYSDFNSDGFDDLAIGVPGDNIQAASGGAAHVLRGTLAGLTSSGSQFWYQSLAGVSGTSERNDYFGASLASGDFDNDGFDDLAIGVPGENLGQILNAGLVNVLHGSSSGLNANAGSYAWHPNSAEGPEPGDALGSALASGDFNNDGFDDLAIGAPSEDFGSAVNAGTVNVINGSTSGLNPAAGNQVYNQGIGIAGIRETGDSFGSDLAVGDFNNDGFDDLAVGVYREVLDGLEDAGVVNVIRGSASGLSTAGDTLWDQNQFVGSPAEERDFFGAALATGDFDNDGFDDLAIGAHGENVGGIVRAGAVNIVHGSANGLSRGAGTQYWNQNSQDAAGRAVRNAAEPIDLFGAELACGDFNNDGFDDLAIGVPNETINGNGGAGAVNVLYGSSQGLTAAGNQFWHQDVDGIATDPEPGESFGAALTVGDFDNDGFDDLAIGIPDEESATGEGTGACSVLYGSKTGLTRTADDLWDQFVLPGTPFLDDFFGNVLA